MISRLTAIAATFAIIASASLAFAAGSHTASHTAFHDSAGSSTAATKHVRVVQLEPVVITGKRLHTAD